MTREHKLALIFGFALVLVVGLLISDNFSASRKSEPGGPSISEASLPMMKEEVKLAGGGTRNPEVQPFNPSQPSITEPAGTSLPPTTTMGINEPTLVADSGLGNKIGRAWNETIQDLQNGHAETPAAVKTETRPLQENPALLRESTQATSLPDSSGTAGLEYPRPVDPPATSGLDNGPGSDLGGLGVSPSRPERDPAPVPSAEPRPETTSKDKSYQIAEGDNFWKIAKKQYGDGSLADALKDYNKARIGKNGQLRVGASLLIPEKSALKGGKKAGPAPAPKVAEKPSTMKVPTKESIEKLTKNDSKTAPKESKKPLTYTAKSGDTLEKIAIKFFGSAGRADDILEANRNLLDSAEDLQAGQTIKIPAR